MAFLGQTFETKDIAPLMDFSPVPESWYNARITTAELKDTKAGNGTYIAVRYDITGPTHQGRVVFGNLNITNPNQKAEEIGRQQLGALCTAIGLERVSDTDELVGGNLQIKLSIKTDEQYGSRNEVKAFKAMETVLETSNRGAKTAKAPWA